MCLAPVQTAAENSVEGDPMLMPTQRARGGPPPAARRTLMAQLMAGAPVASSGMWLLFRAFHAILAL